MPQRQQRDPEHMRTFSGHNGSVKAVAVAVAADGRITLSGSADHVVRMWDIACVST